MRSARISISEFVVLDFSGDPYDENKVPAGRSVSPHVARDDRVSTRGTTRNQQVDCASYPWSSD